MHSVQLAHVRHEMKQRIKAGVPEEDLVLLKIAKAEEQNSEVFERIHSREFRYKGEMYDVIRLEEKGNTTYYTCIHDVKESKLFEQLDEMVVKTLTEDTRERHQQEIMLGFFTKVYLPGVRPELSYFQTKAKSVFAYYASFSEKHSSELGEPPRFMFFI